MNYFAVWGIFNYPTGTQDTELTKSLHTLHLVTEVLIKPLCFLQKIENCPSHICLDHGIHMLG